MLNIKFCTAFLTSFTLALVALASATPLALEDGDLNLHLVPQAPLVPEVLRAPATHFQIGWTGISHGVVFDPRRVGGGDLGTVLYVTDVSSLHSVSIFD